MDDSQIQAFIAKWAKSGGAERANYQLFLTELCDVLDVDHPDPTGPSDDDNKYVFEKNVVFDNGDGTRSTRRIDLYRRGSFICETKQGIEKQDAETPLSERAREAQKKRKAGHGQRGTKAYDDTMLRARGQAEQYARNLPAAEGRPPILMVIDVGHSIELYAEFTQTGGVYTPFPDPLTHRTKLADLATTDVRERLRLVWTDPQALDPAKRSAKVTRDIAAKLAELAKSLEKSGHDPEDVAQFLMRCLFTMFAEDVGLLDPDSFKSLLKRLDDPAGFVPTMQELWRTMNIGGFSVSLNKIVKRFNGGLFAECTALPLTRDQLDLLIEAADKSWNDVEPAIFGTLLERALSSADRHKLGAHFTPRAYVERLVIPTIIEPLRAEWDATRIAAVALAKQGATAGAVAELQRFHDRLCEVTVLDPACGSGNFLYVTLEHLKRIEGEVFNQIEAIADRQTMLAWQETTEGKHTVDPHQLLGIEINPRAAAIAELVLWIGCLQWHFRTRGKVAPPEPIIKDFKNIECRDAVLSWTSRQVELDDAGKVVTHWDGRTTKHHPVTGEEVPDDTARIPAYRYLNPAKAPWPEVDFIVGNPPFIGNKRMRLMLGDGYVQALREAYVGLPETIDYVMYWWERSAIQLSSNRLRRFGLITTNSITQTFNRRLLESHLTNGVSISFACPDHPWVDTVDGANVRIAMTVGTTEQCTGRLDRVISEEGDEQKTLNFESLIGRVNFDLTVGRGVVQTAQLKANRDLCLQGCKLVGSGFVVDEDERNHLIANSDKLATYLPRYVTGNDLTKKPKRRYAIDFFGLTEKEARDAFPAGYQIIVDRVKPERDQNRRDVRKRNWWLFGENAPKLRRATRSLKGFLATSEVAKNRFFSFLDLPGNLADGSLAAIATDDFYFLGVLSSRCHVVWAMNAGGRLEDRPRYQNGPCFLTFPFPITPDGQRSSIRKLARQLDAHRKRQQELHPALTMTGMYNVLEKLRAGEPLTAKEKTIHEQGLVSVLKQIHDELDAAVADAYGWPVDLTDEEILERLVALNHERAAEEARGVIRWLRPEFQNPDGKTQRRAAAVDEAEDVDAPKPAKPAKTKKLPWPKALSDQAAMVQGALVAIDGPADVAAVAARFTRANKERIEELLETLASLGKARELADGRWVAV